MEKIKRVTSALLALVLVLGMVPGVPVTAGAEEVETQPETVILETTEAASVPEETEAPVITEPVTTEAVETVPETTAQAETEPAGTVPAETVVEETVPAQTEPEQTVPAETEAETVPAETEETVPVETVVEETIPAETVEEADASAEAAGEVILVPVTGITISAPTKRTYVGDRVVLKAVVEPANADNDQIIWELYEEEGDDDITNDIVNTALLEQGVLCAEEAGIAKVRAVSVQDPEIASDPVEVEFVWYRMEINLLPVPEENLTEEKDTLVLQSGESVAVSVKYMTLEGGADEWKAEYLMEPSLTWSLAGENDDLYASLTVNSADPREVTLKAKTVTDTKIVTLKAVDRIAGEAQVEAVIYSDPYKVELRQDGEIVTGKTIVVDLADPDLYDEDGKIRFRLEGAVVPALCDQYMLWESSSNMIASVKLEEEDILLTEDEVDYGAAVTVTMGGISGKATITVTCKEDPDIQSTVTIEAKRLLQPEQIDFTWETAQVTELVAGESAQLKVADIRDPEEPVVLDSSVVTWVLDPVDEPYAKLTEGGKLTARDVEVGKVITVICKVIGKEDDRYADEWLTMPVVIRPKADYVQILDADGEVCSGSNLYVNTDGGYVAPFALNFQVLPRDEEPEMGAKQEVNWKSSNTAIATIDPYSDEIVWEGKNGTVTITATAADGSGKKDSVKVTFGVMAETLSIDYDNVPLRSGSSMELSAKITPAGVTVDDVQWYLGAGDEAYAKISSSGKLTAKTVYETHQVVVYATVLTVDPETMYPMPLTAEATITIRPKKDGTVTLKSDDISVTKTTQMLDVPSEETITLTAYSEGYQEPVTWKYPSSVIMESSDDYSATFFMTKTGTATVTATSLNTGMKATVTLKGVRKTAEVVIQEDEDSEGFYLATGKSLTLKAKSYDDEGKTPTQKKLDWFFADAEDYAYAKISSSGKVTAYAGPLTERRDITVVAMATDGSEVSAECTVTICPIAQGVVIRNEEGNMITAYTHKLVEPGEDTVTLTCDVYVKDLAWEAVKWKSSNKAIAEVDEDGVVTVKKTGTVTITATARDGSGKKASVKMKVIKEVADISFDNVDVVAGGKTLTFKPVVVAADGKKPTSSALEWSISGDTAYVSSFRNGVLKTRKVTERMTVTVTAKAKDGSGVECVMEVTICPATTSVQITRDGAIVDRTLTMTKYGIIKLNAISYPNMESEHFNAAQVWTWKTSDKKIAEILKDEDGNLILDADGNVQLVNNGKTGTVTITATAADGTAKKDSIKIKVIP